MTHSAALTGPTLNGRDIGQAEHATRAVLDRAAGPDRASSSTAG